MKGFAEHLNLMVSENQHLVRQIVKTTDVKELPNCCNMILSNLTIKDRVHTLTESAIAISQLVKEPAKIKHIC